MVGVARAVAQPGIDGVLALAGHAQAVQQLARRVEGPVGRAGGRAVEAHVDPGDAGLVQRHAPRQIEGVLLLPAGRPGGQVRRRGRRIRVEPQRRLPEGFEVACDVLCRVLQAVLARRVERELRARVRGRHPLAAVQPVAQLRHTGVGVLRAQHHCKRRAIPTSLTGQALDRMGGRRRRRVIAQERRDCTVARISVAGPVAQPKIQTVRAFVGYAQISDAVGSRQQFAIRRACRLRVQPVVHAADAAEVGGIGPLHREAVGAAPRFGHGGDSRGRSGRVAVQLDLHRERALDVARLIHRVKADAVDAVLVERK